MNRKAARILVASIALIGMIGLSSPAEAAPAQQQARNVLVLLSRGPIVAGQLRASVVDATRARSPVETAARR